MSYTLTLDCGCSVYVSCDPKTQAAHTRVLERRGSACPIRKHEVGFRLYLWDLLPDRGPTAGHPGIDAPPADDLIAWT
ncbi:MAG: hypothetical protein AB7I13_21300 [Vicinamibacterales bacterium]